MNRLADVKAAQVAAAQRYADELLDAPAIDEVGHESGRGRSAWLGRVTKRYGDFVSVEDVEGDVHNPTRAEIGRGEVHYVWAGPAHPWLANRDLLVIVPLARPMTATRIEKNGRLILDVDEKPVTIKVVWFALGTVPEMDPDTFGGNQSGTIRVTQLFLEVPIPPFSSSVTARANAAGASRRLRRTSSANQADATSIANCVRLRTGGVSPALAVATASSPMPMLILTDRAQGAAQVLRPSGDVSVASWVNELGSGVNLAASIDEAKADDETTWVETSVWNPFILQNYKIALPPAVDPLQTVNHTIFLRARKVWSGSPDNPLSLTVRLIDALNGTVHSASVVLEPSYQDFAVRIPDGTSILAYTALQLFLLPVTSAQVPGSLVKPRMTHIFLRVPEINLKRQVRGVALAATQVPRRLRTTVVVPSGAVALPSALSTRVRRHDTADVAVATGVADAMAVKAGSAAVAAIAIASAVATKNSGIESSVTAVANAQSTAARVRRASSSVSSAATAVALSTRIRLESGSSSVVARSTSTATPTRLRVVTANATAIASAAATATKLGTSITSAVTATANALANGARVRPAASAVVARAMGAAFPSVETTPPPPPPPPPPTDDPEPCAIKLIPYREPVYPYKRRMAGLLQGGRIAVCVPTRSERYNRRRAWVGALRSDGQVGEGASGLGKAIVGHAVRDEPLPKRRFAIAQVTCDRECKACPEAGRVAGSLCFVADLRNGPFSGTFRFRECAPGGGLTTSQGPFSFAPGLNGVTFTRIFRDSALPLAPAVSFHPDAIPPEVLSGAHFFVCKTYFWGPGFTFGRSTFILEELYFEDGGFAAYIGSAQVFARVFNVATIVNSLHVWIPDPQWPFEPTVVATAALPERLDPGFIRPIRLGPCAAFPGVA